jgi:hypothetical protein
MTSGVAAVMLVAAVALPAAAQTRRPPAPPVEPRWELGAGGGLLGPLSFGDRDANLRANGTQPGPYRLFTSETRLASAPMAEVRVGYRVTPRLVAEGRLSVGRPALRSSLSADVEGAAAVEAENRITEYAFEGGAMWRFPGSGRHRWTPFASGGAGVVRHVLDRRTLVENAFDGYVGGGAIYARASTRRGAPRSGVRADARVQFLRGGIAEAAGVKPRIVLAGSYFVTF